jgi:hypothetical protein
MGPSDARECVTARRIGANRTRVEDAQNGLLTGNSPRKEVLKEERAGQAKGLFALDRATGS